MRSTFHILPVEVLPEGTVTVIALEDPYFFGILSSRVHVVWALAAGGTLEDRPRYNKTLCFDRFPFPAANPESRNRIRRLGDALHALRTRRLSQRPNLTITSLYNVLEKLRSGESLSSEERGVHSDGLVSALNELHNRIDAAAFDAYGWPHDLTDEQVLERLVALNAERVEEERRGLIRWLRPEFQNPKGEEAAQGALVDVRGKKGTKAAKAATEVVPWPKELSARIAAVRSVLESRRDATTTEEVARSFKKAPRAEVASILESLSMLGLARTQRDGDRFVWSAVRIA